MVLFCLSAFLAGCGLKEAFGEKNQTQNETDAQHADKQGKLVDSGPVQGGTLTLLAAPVDTLNPYRTSSRYVYHISFFVYESLFVQTGENLADPLLVTKWSNQDYTEWSFTIRDDVYFHNGRELTSYDIRHTLRLLGESGSPFFNTWVVDNIQEFRIINSFTFEILLKKPDEAFTRKLVFPVLSQSGGEGEQQFIEGSGPYKYESIDDSGIVLVRNDKWWGDNPPYIDSVVFKICGEDEMLDAFQNNEADIAFIRNVDFTRFEHRTDLNFQVYPDNEGNFLYVNPESLFGQLNRQKALFRYVINRIRDINLGHIQYFDEYDDTPIDTEEFRNALIQSGLYWNETKKSFMHLNAVSIVVPKQDLQKLYTANFLVKILQDAGIPAEVKSVSPQEVKRAIQNGAYDLSPVTGEIKPWETLDDTLKRMQRELGYGVENFYIIPLYRNQQAVLFRNYIRGEKKATFWNPYLGFQKWYIPVFTKGSLK